MAKYCGAYSAAVPLSVPVFIQISKDETGLELPSDLFLQCMAELDSVIVVDQTLVLFLRSIT